MAALEELQTSTTQVVEGVERTTVSQNFHNCGVCGRMTVRKFSLKFAPRHVGNKALAR